MNGPILTLFISLHSVLTLSNFWVRPALGKIVYCENIPTYIKSHFNSMYAMDFFLKSLQEMKQKLY